MKVISALLLIGFFSVKAEAQTMGCYIDFLDPSVCATNTVYCQPVPALNYALYGNVVGDACQTILVKSSEYSACVGSYDSLVTDYNLLLRYARKLKKACGSRCNKVR